jgi:hypothetical protein
LALWFFDEAADGDFGLAHVRLKALTMKSGTGAIFGSREKLLPSRIFHQQLDERETPRRSHACGGHGTGIGKEGSAASGNHHTAFPSALSTRHRFTLNKTRDVQ